MKTFLILSIAVTALVTGEEFEVDSKAASRQVNCECQCSEITFLDKYGKQNGNCKSADKTGALWCYVDPNFNRCSDLQRSERFGQKLWSYQACATPEIGAPLCPYGGNFNNGGFNNGGFNNGGLNNNGGYNPGSNNGGFNNGGFSNNGGFNNGGLNNNGGYNPGSNNGGLNNNGGYNPGSNNGGFTNGGLNNNGGYNNGGLNNNGGYPGIRTETEVSNGRVANTEEKKSDSVNFGN